MTERIEIVPGGDHPIFITHNPARVIVRLEGQVVADTKEALTLLEANYPAVQYIPRKDVDMARLEKAATQRIAPTRASPAISASPLAARARTMRHGLTKSLTRRSPRSRTTWPSIPIALIPSTSWRKPTSASLSPFQTPERYEGSFRERNNLRQRMEH